MSPYVAIYLAISAISVLSYTVVAYSNWRLSKVLESINGEGVYIIRVLAVLSIIVVLEDLFWIIVLVLPRVIGDAARTEFALTSLIVLNIIMRVIPLVALFRMRDRMFRKNENRKAQEAERHGTQE